MSIRVEQFEAELTDLTPTSNNPRQINKKDFEKLKKSLKEFPEMKEIREVVIDENNRILGGHMRVRALKELGEKTVFVKQVFGLTEEQKDEFVIKDNIANGEWDMDELANSWSDLPLDDWGIGVEWDTSEQDVVEDEVPEVDDNEPADSVGGGVYQLGRHRLMCGDSTNAGDVAILMDGQKADLWLTDPPYNIAYEGGSKKRAAIENDEKEDGDFRNFLAECYSVADSVMSSGAVFYIFHADSESYNFRGAAIDIGWKIRENLIWNKNNSTFGRQDYHWKHEPCLYGWKDGSHNWYSDRKQTTVLDFDRPSKSDEHPTMKPINLIAYLLNNSSKKDDNVLDSFGGSGSTLIACEQLGRKCYMMELDPKYCDVIRKRYWKLKTGSEEGWQKGTKEAK